MSTNVFTATDVKMSSDLQDLDFNVILNFIRVSGYNFNIKETPYSCYITLRKTRIKAFLPQSTISGNFPSSTKVDSDREIAELKSDYELLETRCDHLKHELGGAVDELEEKNKNITDLLNDKTNLMKQIEASQDTFEVDVANRIKNSIEEKRLLQIKHERTCAEQKQLKNELGSFQQELRSTQVALKASKRENKETSHNFNKKIENLEYKVNNLQDYKVTKVSEEKELKSKFKKVDKKLKAAQEKEAKLSNEIKSWKLKKECDINDNINENADETASPTVNQTIPEEVLSTALTASTTSTNSTTLSSPEPAILDTPTQNDMIESDTTAIADFVDNVKEDGIDTLMAKAEKKARDKAKGLVKKKLALKLENVEISNAMYKELEDGLIEDM